MFKIGDKLKCVEGYCDDLIVGNIYECTTISGGETIKVTFGGAYIKYYWDPRRFILAKPAKKIIG